MTQVNIVQEQQVVEVTFADVAQYSWFFIPDGGAHPTGLYIKANASTAFEVSTSAQESFAAADIILPALKVDITYYLEA